MIWYNRPKVGNPDTSTQRYQQRVSNLVRHRLGHLSCYLGMLCGALLVGLSVLTISAATDSTSTPLLAAFDEVLQRVVSLRHLQPKATIKRAVRNRQQIRTAVLALTQDALSPAEWEAERKAMVQWGLIAPDFRLKEFVFDLLAEQIGRAHV